MMSAAPTPILAPDRDSCRRLRELLDRHDYSETRVGETLGDPELPKRTEHFLPRLLWRTRRDSPHETLIRLFLLNIPVSEQQLLRAFEPEDPQAWAAAGLLRRTGDGYASNFRLMPYQDMVLASDWPDDVVRGARSDYVLPLTNSAVTVAHCTIRRHSRASLDVGSGNGILSFLAARHSDSVCGVDLNPRAVIVARFNAWLNNIDNVEFVEGNAFQPVTGRKFDLIVSNPPFMISPCARYIFRDAGMELDGFLRKLVGEAPEYLEEGGICQMTGDWVHLAGQDPRERLAGWFEGAGCDAFVLELHRRDPAEYGEAWLETTEPQSMEIDHALFNEWMEYYEQNRIEAITTGLISMRRAGGKPNWVSFEEPPGEKSQPIGDYILLRFALGDFLERAKNDDVLLESRLVVGPDARLEQECEWTPESWRIVKSELKLVSAMPFSGQVDRYSVAFLARCDGRRTVRELIADLAGAAHVDASRILPGTVALLRNLIERGFLLPAEMAGSKSSTAAGRTAVD